VLTHLPREIAFAELTAMVAAAQILRDEVPGR
jgi:methionine synthase II (cobalamin-independent)